MADPNPKIVIRAKDETARAFKAARSNLTDFKNSAFRLQNVLAGLAGAAGVGALVKNTLEATDQIGKLSTRLGIGTEALSEYKFVAEQSGVTFNTFTMGIQRMGRRVAEAANDTGEARSALKELGIDARELQRLELDQQFEVLGEAIRKVKEPTDQTRLAMKLFDSEGVALLQILKQNSAEVENLRDRARELGLSLSQDQVEGAAAANDAMNELKNAFNGLAIESSTSLAPALTEVTKLLTDFVPKAAEFAKAITDDIGVGIAALWDYLNPSGTTGPTTLQQSVDRVRTATAEVRAEMEKIAEQKKMLEAQSKPEADAGPESTTSEAEKKARLKALNDFAFEDRKTRQHILDMRRNQRILDQETELAELWEFEDRKTAAVRRGELERLEFSKKTAMQQTKIVVSEAIRMTRGVTGESRKLFEINKAAGIANAIINTHEGVTKALSAYPPPLSFAMAAAQLAAGMAEVNAIKSASFGGGGSTRGGVAAPPTAPSDLATPIGPGGVQNVQITIDGTGQLDRSQAEEIARSISEYIRDGGQPLPAA